MHWLATISTQRVVDVYRELNLSTKLPLFVGDGLIHTELEPACPDVNGPRGSRMPGTVVGSVITGSAQALRVHETR